MSTKIKVLLSGEAQEEKFVEIHAGATDVEIIEAFHSVSNPAGSIEGVQVILREG